MKTLTRLLLPVVLYLISLSSIAQEGSYFAAGWSFDRLMKPGSLESIVRDFNNHYSSGGYTLEQALEVPDAPYGLFLGVKFHSDMLTMGIDIHGLSNRSIAKVADSLNQSFERQLKISHSGFSMGMGLNLIGKEGFRMGPMLNLGFEQFRAKTMQSSKFIEPAQDIPVDAFYLSTVWKFPVSVGGKGFTFDLIPYFQLPFYKINMTKLNDNLNEGYAKPYSKADMKMSPMSYGLIITLNFRLSGI